MASGIPALAAQLIPAMKTLKAEKPREGYMRVTVSADILLPMKNAVTLMDALTLAEQAPSYYNSYRITPISKDSISYSAMSAQDYDRYKIAALLNVSYDEVVAAEKESRNSESTTP